MSGRAASCLAAASLSLCACSALGPPDNPGSTSAQTQTAHELDSQPAGETVTGSTAATPVQAVRRFATAYVNWTADSVVADLHALAAASIGQARSALELAAAQAAGDYELRRGGIANRGSVEAVTPLPAARNRYVVVTRETTTATSTDAYQGLQPAWHVAIATVALLPGGRWALSGWQPES